MELEKMMMEIWVELEMLWQDLVMMFSKYFFDCIDGYYIFYYF